MLSSWNKPATLAFAIFLFLTSPNLRAQNSGSESTALIHPGCEAILAPVELIHNLVPAYVSVKDGELRLVAAEFLTVNAGKIKDSALQSVLEEIRDGKLKDPYENPKSKRYRDFFEDLSARSEILQRLSLEEPFLSDFLNISEMTPTMIEDVLVISTAKEEGWFSRVFRRNKQIDFKDVHDFAQRFNRLPAKRRMKVLEKTLVKAPYLTMAELAYLGKSIEDPELALQIVKGLRPKQIDTLSMYNVLQFLGIYRALPKNVREVIFPKAFAIDKVDIEYLLRSEERRTVLDLFQEGQAFAEVGVSTPASEVFDLFSAVKPNDLVEAKGLLILLRKSKELKAGEKTVELELLADEYAKGLGETEAKELKAFAETLMKDLERPAPPAPVVSSELQEFHTQFKWIMEHADSDKIKVDKLEALVKNTESLTDVELFMLLDGTPKDVNWGYSSEGFKELHEEIKKFGGTDWSGKIWIPKSYTTIEKALNKVQKITMPGRFNEILPKIYVILTSHGKWSPQGSYDKHYTDEYKADIKEAFFRKVEALRRLIPQ